MTPSKRCEACEKTFDACEKDFDALLAASEAKVAQLEADVQTAMMTINYNLVPRAETAEASLKEAVRLLGQYKINGNSYAWQTRRKAFLLRQKKEVP